jgi:hypothetical protein
MALSVSINFIADDEALSKGACNRTATRPRRRYESCGGGANCRVICLCVAHSKRCLHRTHDKRLRERIEVLTKKGAA